MSLARRSVTSATWRASSNLVRVAILFVRSILLARMLPIDTFGIYALANSVVTLTIMFTNFGMAGAFLHRAPETKNESEASAVHFTLKSIFITIWAIVLTATTFLWTEGDTRVALLVLIFTTAGVHLAEIEPFGSQSIDVGGSDLGLAVDPQVPRPQVVGHDEHDVGLVDSPAVGGKRQCNRAAE